MIYNSPYDTTVGRIINTDPIVHAIKVSMVRESLDAVRLKVIPKGLYRSFFVTGINDSEKDIPLFTHPLVFESKDMTYVCSDMRLFVNPQNRDVSTIENHVKNKVEYNFAKTRNILSLAWVCGDMGHIRNGLRFARDVFSSFVSQNISRTYSLDPGDQLKIHILANYFYNCLFTNDKEISQDTLQSWAIHTIASTRADSRLVMEIFNSVSKMDDIKDFCKAVVDVCQNSRLSDFSQLTFLTMFRSAWFGTNAKEIIAVAVEHPPTWVAMIYAALQERSYKNSPIAKQAEIMNKRGSAKEFIEGYADIAHQYVDGNIALESMWVSPRISVGSMVKPF